jgi:hypothetical protein
MFETYQSFEVQKFERVAPPYFTSPEKIIRNVCPKLCALKQNKKEVRKIAFRCHILHHLLGLL